MSYIATVMASNNNFFSASGIGIWRDLNRVIHIIQNIIQKFSIHYYVKLRKLGQSYIELHLILTGISNRGCPFGHSGPDGQKPAK